MLRAQCAHRDEQNPNLCQWFQIRKKKNVKNRYFLCTGRAQAALPLLPGTMRALLVLAVLCVATVAGGGSEFDEPSAPPQSGGTLPPASASDAPAASAPPPPPLTLSPAAILPVLLAADWTLPALTLFAVLAILAAGAVVRAAESARASALASALLPPLAAEFAAGCGALTAASSSEYTAWATGRRGVLGVAVRLTLGSGGGPAGWLRGRAPAAVADAVGALAGGGGGSDARDSLELCVALPAAGGAACLVSVVPAGGAAAGAGAAAAPPAPAPGWPARLRARRVDPAPGGAAGVAVHADCRDVAELVLSRDLAAALADLAAAGGGLRGLLVTDLAPLAPAAAALATAAASPRAMRLAVALPPAPADAAAALAALLPALLRAADRLGGRLPPAAAAAVKAVRDEHEAALNEVAEAEKREAARRKRDAERDAERKAAADAEQKRISAIADPERRRKEQQNFDKGKRLLDAEKKMRLMKGVRNVGSMAPSNKTA
jgi:hypothetical protein